MTPRQERFCEEYLVDLNATQAATRAGYSARTANREGSRLLSNADIQARIAELRGAQSKRTLITADEVLAGLKAEAIDHGEGSSHSARVQAWVALGKHLALFVDRHQHEVSGTLEVVEEIIDGGRRPAKEDRSPPPSPGGIP